MNFANWTGYFVPISFGIISPKSTIIKVTIIELTINSSIGCPSKSKILPIRILEMSTIKMFTRLFICKMVPNRYSGLESNFITFSPFLSSLFFKESSCPGVSEKKAVSLPEIRAEQTKSTMSEMPIHKNSNVKLLGGSKF
jgi:hypothetical protein